MNRLGIRGKVWLSIVIFGLGYVAVLILLQWTASQTQTRMKVASEGLFPSALSIQDAQAGFQKVMKRYSDAVVMQEKGGLTEAEKDAEAVIVSLQSVKDNMAFDVELQKNVSDMIDQLKSMTDRAKPAYSAMIDGKDHVSDQTMADVGTLARENKQMEASLADVREHISKSFAAELASVTAASRQQRNLGFIVFLIAVGSGSAMAAFVINHHIVTPLNNLTTRLKDIAEGEGDLTKRLEVGSKDEIGEVAHWLNIFLGKLQQTILQVAGSTQGVATSSSGLTAVSQQIFSNAKQTSTQVSLVSTASEQVSRNLQTVATGAEQMSDTIKDIAKNATEAARVASEAVRVAEETNNTVTKLGASSAEIGKVIKAITSIAQQTNLLALNATIEAARAGEAGKGFAVVANEVKELAKQTAKATEEISQKITAIQNDTKGAVDAIGNIGGVINQINDISNMIATAVEEQSATTNEMSRNASEAAKGSGDIARSIEGVAEAARSTSQGAAESERAAAQLSAMSSELKELVEQFKV